MEEEKKEQKSSEEEKTTTTNRAHHDGVVDLLLSDEENKQLSINNVDKKKLLPPPCRWVAGINSTTAPPPSQQLTIFYSGTVHVFNGIPPEKAQAIMLIAAAAAAAAAAASHIPFPTSTASPHNNTMTGSVAVLPNSSPILTSWSSSLQSTTAVVVSAPLQQFHPIDQNPTTLCKLQAEVPIARRHSLQRFLEKRRDRLVSKIPYSLTPTSTTIRAAEDDKGKSNCSNNTTEATATAASAQLDRLLS